MELDAGRILRGKYGYYRPGSIIGGKKGSTVYRGEIMGEPSYPCAIKEIKNSSQSDAERIQAESRFNRDSEILLRLNNPGIVELIDYFSFEGSCYLIMELVEGVNLESALNRNRKPFQEKEVVEWGIQICKTLYYLHVQRPAIIFGNLRPRNVIKTQIGMLKLVEFGLSNHFKSFQLRDDQSSPYRPPEYCLPEGRMNPRSDLFSLGVMLYELCTGETPGRELTRLKGLTLELGVVLQRSTAADPSGRYRSAKEMKDALIDCLKNPEIA